MRMLATNWAEVANVRGENRGLRSSLEGAQAQQRQAKERARGLEQRAKEADDLKAALDAKVAALAVAEEQLQQEHTILPHVAKQCGMLVIHPLLGL
jgi:chromosome segregation ATPase